MRKLFIVAAASIAAAGVMGCRADNNTDQPLVSPAFRQTTTTDGLPTSRVFSVIQDHQGYIWAATENGLARYDGYQTRVFRHKVTDDTSISGDTIRGMFVDAAGRLWIGVYNGGLDLYQPQTASFSHFMPEEQSSDSKIWTVNGKGHQLWLGTIGNGLFLFDTQTKHFSHFKHDPDNPNSLASNRINNVYLAANGSVWVATSNGLDSYDPRSQHFIHHSFGKQTKGIYVWDITSDDTGRMWVATAKGLYTGQTGSGFSIAFPENHVLGRQEIRALLFTNHEYLWMGSFGGGVWLLNTNTHRLSRFTHDPSVPSSLIDDDVWDIFEDRVGTLWITTDLGISRLVRNAMQISLITNIQENGKSSPIGQITGLHSIGNRLYVATSQGIVVITVTADGLKEKRINSKWTLGLARSHDGHSMWIGVYIDTLLHTSADGKILQTFHIDYQGHGLGQITSIADDGKYLWLGTFDFGLFRFDPVNGNVRPYTLPVSDNLWKQINELRFHDGKLLIGTSSGVAILDPGSGNSRIVENPAGLKGSFSVISIFQSGTDRYFLGTSAGLMETTFTTPDTPPTLTLVKGLSGDDAPTIDGIERDDSGKLWLSSDYGLLIYSPDTGDIRRFSKSQGLPISLFTIRAHAETGNGRLWFGGPYGLISFIPSGLEHKPVHSGVVVNNMTYYLSDQAYTQPVYGGMQPITLEHQANIIQFDFSALNYVYPSGSNYRYRLLGLENEWVNLGTRHELTLTNVPPGGYRLELEASDNAGAWSTPSTTFDFSVLPPWWRTWWAYLAYTLLILGAMLAYVHAQQRKLRREREISAKLRDADAIKSGFVAELETQVNVATGELKNTLEAVNLKNQELEIAHKRASEGEQLKSQFLASMSHELRTPLTAIQGYLKLLARTDTTAEQMDYLRTVQHSSESLLAIINDTLDLSRIESGKLLIDEVDFNLLELIESTIELLGPSAYSKHIALLRIIPPDIPLQLRGDPLRVRQILTNLIGNAIKFTQSGSVCVRVQEIERREKQVILGVAVSDTGIGIPQSATKKLFEAYARHEPRNLPAVEGTGLGLSICKKLLDLMGGEIDVMSTPGVGSTFEFRLAFKIRKHPAPIPQFPRHMKIGLLDNHPLSHQAWRASLTRFGLDVISIRNPAALKDMDIRLLVIILNMEEMDKADDIARRLTTLAVPHIVLASTNDREILGSLGGLFRGHAFSNLAHEASILSEIRALIPALPSPSTAAGDTAGDEPVAGRQDTRLRPLILVADDNAINRKLLVTLLMQNDYRVAEAASGEELLELAARESWDLALVDIHMPDMNGIEATQKLLASLTGVHPPIIAVSADALPETRASALAAGMRDYLLKPYSEQQLLDMLHRYLKSVD